MRLKNRLFYGVVLLTIISALAFKPSTPKQIYNTGLLTDCAPIASCLGGNKVYTFKGRQLNYIIGVSSGGVAFYH